jgi:hypothetical protein
MKSFEARFGIPAAHRLVLTRSRIRGGSARGEFWEHEEFDPRGVLVARYESFTELDPATGATHSGWYRYDSDGFLIDRHDRIPERLGDLLA